MGDAFRAWVRFLYLIVEMENALTNDFGYLSRAITRGEDPGELTPYKVQLTAETHRRFLSNYFDPVLGDELQQLWAITIGLCAPREDVRRLRRELDSATAPAETDLVRACAGIMTELNERLQESDGTDASAGERLRALGALNYREDRRFLAELKLALRDGVRAFEEHQGETPAPGGGQLMESLLTVAAVARGYAGRMAAGMRAIGIALPAAGAAPGAEPGQVEFPGHGAVFGLADVERSRARADPAGRDEAPVRAIPEAD